MCFFRNTSWCLQRHLCHKTWVLFSEQLLCLQCHLCHRAWVFFSDTWQHFQGSLCHQTWVFLASHYGVQSGVCAIKSGCFLQHIAAFSVAFVSLNLGGFKATHCGVYSHVCATKPGLILASRSCVSSSFWVVKLYVFITYPLHNNVKTHTNKCQHLFLQWGGKSMQTCTRLHW